MSDKILKLSQAQTLYQDLRERIDALPTDSDIPEVPVQDVQINGTSILNQGMANIPPTDNGVYGVVKLGSGKGLRVNNDGQLYIDKASINNIKNSASIYTPLMPIDLNAIAFYGLAKAAGDSTQSVSTNAVGVYTNDAKSAIQNMLGVPSTNDLNIYATKADTVLDTTLSRGRAENSDIGENSFAFGEEVTASGISSHAEGQYTTASGEGAHAEGQYTTASGDYSHTEGVDTIASGNCSHAEGQWSEARGYCSHASGLYTVAAGDYSHVTGYFNAIDSYDNLPEWVSGTSYAEGDTVKRVVNNTTLSFICITANSDTVFDSKKWFRNESTLAYLEIVGNGDGDNNIRSNARALTWKGDEKLAGDLYVHADINSRGGIKVATINDIPSVPVQDVQVNGTSILSSGVANIEEGAWPKRGFVTIYPGYGITMRQGGTYNGMIQLDVVDDSVVKNSTKYAALRPSQINLISFYGLAKAAGDITQYQSNNAVGTYTDAAKQAIQNMLGITSLLSTEEAATATAAHVANSLFLMGGKLHKATSAIAVGDAVETGTNCQVVKADEVFVKNTDYATANTPGIVKVEDTTCGLRMSTDGTYIRIVGASTNKIKNGTEGYCPITPSTQHYSIYYGLSKLAGVDLKNETVTLGTYPETSKTAIRSLIGAGTPIDVQINGASIVSGGVANIPVADGTNLGVVKVNISNGIGISGQVLYISGASDTTIKAGTHAYNPIVPLHQHEATFYGLAKASGDTTQVQSNNAVGTYTTEAATSIKTMLQVQEGLKVVRLI